MEPETERELIDTVAATQGVIAEAIEVIFAALIDTGHMEAAMASRIIRAFSMSLVRQADDVEVGVGGYIPETLRYFADKLAQTSARLSQAPRTPPDA